MGRVACYCCFLDWHEEHNITQAFNGTWFYGRWLSSFTTIFTGALHSSSQR